MVICCPFPQLPPVSPGRWVGLCSRPDQSGITMICLEPPVCVCVFVCVHHLLLTGSTSILELHSGWRVFTSTPPPPLCQSTSRRAQSNKSSLCPTDDDNVNSDLAKLCLNLCGSRQVREGREEYVVIVGGARTGGSARTKYKVSDLHGSATQKKLKK